jgi:hypothetical protein
MADEIKLGAQPGRVNFPTSPECGRWETLLADALDGLLRPEDEGTFSSHMATCAYCAEMFEQARRGREWLEFLAPEPEVPAYLLDKILAGTGHGKPGEGKFAPGKLAVAGGPLDADNVLTMVPAWQQPGFAGRMRRFAEPRLLMTAAMAFFSIALTLSMTGVRFSAIKMADLRPASLRSAVEKRIMTASTPIVRYYDHLRFVYEVESTVRELRRNSENQPQTPAQTQQQPGGESRQKDGGSKLDPRRNPNEAPQQTGNPAIAPSLSLWGSDTEQARLELPFSRQFTAAFQSTQGNSTPSGPTAPKRQALPRKGVLARPDRSTSCLA